MVFSTSTLCLPLVFPAGFLVSGGVVWNAFISISRGMSNLDVLILKVYSGPTRALMRVLCLKHTTRSEGILDNHMLLGHCLHSLTCPFIDLHHLFLSFHFAGPQWKTHFTLLVLTKMLSVSVLEMGISMSPTEVISLGFIPTLMQEFSPPSLLKILLMKIWI